MTINEIIKRLDSRIGLTPKTRALNRIYARYRDYTMVFRDHYLDNLRLAEVATDLAGDVVECGVWKGGMIAGISEILGPQRKYFLFDSFEGLPAAKKIDGAAARNWQANRDSPEYLENCAIDARFALEAMKIAKVDFDCIKGWFEDTLPEFEGTSAINFLRLDADWYDSTMTCLEHLFPKVVEGGLVLIDDYHTWSGCSRAVHDYLSTTKSPSRISQTPSGVAYLIKRTND